MWNKIFFIDYQTLILEKRRRKRDEKKWKEEGIPNLLLIITLLFMSSKTQNIFYLCSDREISDIILIIKCNISSYN